MKKGKRRQKNRLWQRRDKIKVEEGRREARVKVMQELRDEVTKRKCRKKTLQGKS